MSFTTLRPQLQTKLETLSTFNQVLPYHTTGLTKFPVCTFEPDGNDSKVEDTAFNLRAYKFSVYIHQELTTIGRSEAVRILSAAVDEFIKAFEEDFTLGGDADYLLEMNTKFKTYKDGNASVLYAEGTITANQLIQVVT